MPVNDGSNIRLTPLQPMQLPDVAREVGSLLTAMRRASGGGGGGRREKGASLFNPVTKQFEFIPGGSEEERQRNLQSLVNFQLNERFRGGQTKASQSINEKLKNFGNSSVERQAQILEDIRRNDIPVLAQQTGVDGQLFTDGPLAQLAAQQKTNAQRVEDTGTGSILWDSLRTGWRSFTDGLADIFSDSQEQMSRANARQQYVQNIQAENAYLRNRELRRQEGADFLDRLSPGEVVASTGEFLGENLVPLGAAVAGGAIGAAAGRALGASARAGSFAGQAVPGGLLGMGSQVSAVGDEIINNPDLTLEQKQQALEDAKAPAMALGGALGAMVLPAGQMARRGLASTRARLGLGDSYVARTVQARHAGRPIPNGLNSWDDALSNARRDDMLAENAIINGGFGGRWRQQMADSMLEGAGFAGLGQIGTNAIVGNDLTENLGSALAGGTLGGALFTPFNRRTPYTYNQIPAIRPQILALGAPGPQAAVAGPSGAGPSGAGPSGAGPSGTGSAGGRFSGAGSNRRQAYNFYYRNRAQDFGDYWNDRFNDYAEYLADRGIPYVETNAQQRSPSPEAGTSAPQSGPNFSFRNRTPNFGDYWNNQFETYAEYLASRSLPSADVETPRAQQTAETPSALSARVRTALRSTNAPSLAMGPVVSGTRVSDRGPIPMGLETPAEGGAAMPLSSGAHHAQPISREARRVAQQQARDIIGIGGLKLNSMPRDEYMAQARVYIDSAVQDMPVEELAPLHEELSRNRKKLSNIRRELKQYAFQRVDERLQAIGQRGDAFDAAAGNTTTGGSSTTAAARMGQTDAGAATRTAVADNGADSRGTPDAGNVAAPAAVTVAQRPDGSSGTDAERGDAGSEASGTRTAPEAQGTPATEAPAEQAAVGERGARAAAPANAEGSAGAGSTRTERGTGPRDGGDAADAGSNEQPRDVAGDGDRAVEDMFVVIDRSVPNRPADDSETLDFFDQLLKAEAGVPVAVARPDAIAPRDMGRVRTSRLDDRSLSLDEGDVPDKGTALGSVAEARQRAEAEAAAEPVPSVLSSTIPSQNAQEFLSTWTFTRTPDQLKEGLAALGLSKRRELRTNGQLDPLKVADFLNGVVLRKGIVEYVQDSSLAQRPSWVRNDKRAQLYDKMVDVFKLPEKPVLETYRQELLDSYIASPYPAQKSMNDAVSMLTEGPTGAKQRLLELTGLNYCDITGRS